MASVNGEPPDDEELLGKRLAHFTILARLGAGGMGVVYRARDDELERDVALKVLPAAVTLDDERRRRFLREARAAAAVTHVNVATVFEVGESAGRIFIAMELIDGAPLRARLGRGPLAVDEAVAIASAVARGLARAHERGFIHRDLKPENVMLDRDGLVKLLDFGLAKVLDVPGATGGDALASAPTAMADTAEGRVLGTPGYMSPEQARGHAVDARTDVFSLGIVLFEMLTGRLPFRGETMLDLLAALARDEVPPASTLNASVPPDLDRLVARCLDKDPAGRPASAREVLAELDGLAWRGRSQTGSASVATSGSGRAAAVVGGAAISGATAVVSRSLVSLPAAPRVRARWWTRVAVGLGLSALLAGGASFFRARSSPTEPSPTAAAALAASASPATTDAGTRAGVGGFRYLAHPRTSSGEAAREYVLGVQATHDGDIATGIAHLRRALAADPGFAMAHFILAGLVRNADPEEGRREFATAWALREQLSDYELALARGTEPMIVPDPYDFRAARDRVTELVARYPDDALALNQLSLDEWGLGHLAKAAEFEQRALALDPQGGLVLSNLASIQASAGKLDEALGLLDRCLELNRTMTTCLAFRMTIRDHRGDCAGYEADARQFKIAAPGNRTALFAWANGLAATAQPEGAVHEALERSWAAVPDADRAAVAASDRAALAVLRGDLGAALRELDAVREWPFHSSKLNRWTMVTRLRLDLLDELGRSADAAREARSTRERLPAMSRNPNGGADRIAQDLGPLLLGAELKGGLLDAPGRDRARRAWVDEWRGILGPDSDFRAHLWVRGFAEPARTEPEAKEALAALAELGPVPVLLTTAGARAGVGRAYLLVGEHAAALPYLEGAARACTPLDDPVAAVRASLDLGRARARGGDKAGACQAFAAVASRWGKSRARSAREAADDARAAACPP